MVTSIWDAYKEKAINQNILNMILMDDFRDHNATLLKVLKEKLQAGETDPSSRKILPVLGSGISAPAGLPTWDNLLNLLFPIRLEMQMLPPEIKSSLLQDPQKYGDVLDALNTGNMIPPYCGDYLEYGEYIKQACDNGNPTIQGQEFLERTKKAMIDYRGNTFTCSDIQDQENYILGKVSRLIFRFSLNAITYNFDNLLEACLAIVCGAQNVKCIAEADKMYTDWDLSTIKVYHVHGSLQMDGLEAYGTASQKITFAESEYYDAEHFGYEWLNAVQAERIHHKNMVIIGFAAQDFNFKRILRNMKPYDTVKKVEDLTKDDPIHFIFLPVEDIFKSIKLPLDMLTEQQMVNHADFPQEMKTRLSAHLLKGILKDEEKILKQNYFLKAVIATYMIYKEEYLHKYHIYPIWTSHTVLPTMLDYLISSTP